jgi:hypothetical protein
LIFRVGIRALVLIVLIKAGSLAKYFEVGDEASLVHIGNSYDS